MTATDGFDPSQLREVAIPPRILCSGLGGLNPGVGIDSFETELHPGDVFLSTSDDLANSSRS